MICALQIKGDLSKNLKEVPDHSLPLCWKGKKPFKSVLDVKKEFKTVVLSFSNGKKALMEIPPENYLIVTVNILELRILLVINYALLVANIFLCLC